MVVDVVIEAKEKEVTARPIIGIATALPFPLTLRHTKLMQSIIL
jgi:hypothetical protein